jgi:hypothetical protein
MLKFKLLSLLLLPFLLFPQILRDDFRLNDDSTGAWTYEPDIQITNNGEAVVVWRDHRIGSASIYAQAYGNSGNPVGNNFKVSEYIGPTEYSPAITQYYDSLLVVWQYGYGRWMLPDGSFPGSSFYLYSGSIREPDIAVSDSVFVVVWENYIGGHSFEIVMKRFNFNGDSLGPRVTVNDDGTMYTQNEPSIAIDKSGNYVVVWEDYRDGNYYEIYGQMFSSSGIPMGSNFRINDDTLSNKLSPSCAKDSSGNFIVVWYDYRNGNYDIFGQLFDSAGNTLDSNFQINDDIGTTSQSNPSCAMNKSGDFVVVWRDGKEGNNNIYGRLYDGSGNPQGISFRIDQDPGIYEQDYPSVSMNNINFSVTWYDERIHTHIYKRRFQNDGTPLENEVRVDEPEGTTSQQIPAMDMNSSGNIVAVWEDHRLYWGIYFQRLTVDGDLLGENTRIDVGYESDVAVAEDGDFAISYRYASNVFLQRVYASGDTISPRITVNDTTLNSRYGTSIDIDSLKNIVVTWYDYRDGNSDIYAALFDWMGNPIGSNFEVNDDIGISNQYYPDIAIQKSGKFLITWQDYRNNRNDIYCQLYDETGNPLGANFRINEDTVPSGRYNPDISILPDGYYIVVWQDNRTPAGICGQIIDSLGIPVDTNFKISDISGSYPSIFVEPSGKFVVTWHQWDGTDYDIYAQKYNQDRTPDAINFKVNNEQEGLNPNQSYSHVVTNGDHTIFIWQDAKWELGYDIACKVVEWSFTSIDEDEIISEDIKLMQIKPNPFMEKATISYILNKPMEINISIYDITGRLIKTLRSGRQIRGMHEIVWDGKNNKGEKISSGIYFCHLMTDEKSLSRKIILLR